MENQEIQLAVRWSTVPRIAQKWALIKQAVHSLPKNATNSNFGSRYTTLDVVLERLEEQFSQHKLLRTGVPGYRDGAATLLTSIYDLDTGEELVFESQAPCSPGATMHKWGGMETYLRRMTDIVLLSLPQEDDDGNTASLSFPEKTGAVTAPKASSAAPLPKLGGPSVPSATPSPVVAEVKPEQTPTPALPRLGGVKKGGV